MPKRQDPLLAEVAAAEAGDTAADDAASAAVADTPAAAADEPTATDDAASVADDAPVAALPPGAGPLAGIEAEARRLAKAGQHAAAAAVSHLAQLMGEMRTHLLNHAHLADQSPVLAGMLGSLRSDGGI